MAGAIGQKEERMMRTLLILDTLRGEHSTGVAAIARHVEPLIVKAVGNAFELFDTHGYTKAMQRVNKALIGHNRYATVGKINRACAHPFQYGNVIGAHNGTLRNKHALDDGNSFEVDSQAFYNHIDKHGIQDAVNKVDGAWALTWWNTERNSLNVLRNKERPLWLAWSKDNKTVFWASERWMLSIAASSAKVEIEQTWELAEDLHMELIVPNSPMTDLPDFDAKEVKSSYVPFIKPAATTVTYPPAAAAKNTTTSSAGTSYTGTVTYPPSVSQRNVHRLPETHQGASTVINNQNDLFSNKKDVTMRIVGKGQDVNGALYAIGDVENCSFKVRLYMKSKEEYDDIAGTSVQGNLGNLFRNPKEGYFYKMTYTSYRIVDDMYEDKDGKPMMKADWITKYGSCCWCTGFVDPDQTHRFSRLSDEAVCSTCCEDVEVKTYV